MAAGAGPAAEETTDFSQIYGSGQLAIRSVTFSNRADGTSVAEVGARDAVTMRVEYECRVPEVADPVVDVLVRDADGIFFQTTNAECGQLFEPLRGTGIIEVVFDRVPANNQRLLFFVAVMNGRTKEIYDWKRNIPLHVSSASSGQGRVHLACHWTVRPHHLAALT
jgi:hypothetical protein